MTLAPDIPLQARLEVGRKLIHIGFGFAALLLRWLTREQAAAIALAAVLFNLFLFPRLGATRLYRGRERDLGYSLGMIAYPVAVLLLVVALPAPAAGAIWAILAFGDGFASLAGRGLGGPSLPWNQAKTWTGLIAFVATGTVGAAATHHFIAGSLPHEALAAAFLTALAAGLAETVPIALADNVTILVVAGPLYPLILSASGAPLAARAAEAGWAAAAVNSALAAGAWKMRALDASGAAAAFFVGMAAWLGAGWQGFAVLLAFFVLGSGATRLGVARKTALGVAQAHGGARSARNVLANGAVPAAMALLTTAGPAWLPLGTAYAGAVAAAGFDTVSSEIGEWLGTRTWRILSLQPCKAGEDGGISLEGTAAGFAAAAIVTALAVVLGALPAAHAPAVLVGAAAGGTVDSILGDTLERRGWIDNEAVNFMCTYAGAVVAGLMAL